MIHFGHAAAHDAHGAHHAVAAAAKKFRPHGLIPFHLSLSCTVIVYL